ncbi:YkgJ family cysteine cluster protein [Halorubrum sp. AD140]|uniref:YkgJ family cysteine cluster protein n=1 Tax=Halorubrum sp. AD140 TaxID=3050073 RepID=UPI002ACCE741|nr:YkgJ family cysteine cluster protein [Halorubrum sp. AD140]MDZ5812606.1 YkgJ family cysteine cluster protein [Halorubrum sp. AD140]
MESLEAELERARGLPVDELADAIESIGFECTRCGGCCTGYAPDEPGGAPAGEGKGEADAPADPDAPADREPHTATVFPDEVRDVAAAAEERFGEPYDWRDVARPMPFGLSETDGGEQRGETFEWALATDDCGDCAFYEEADGTGACTVHDSRPLICRTYPFSVALDGTSQPMGEAVDAEGIVRAHECEGLGREVSRGDAEALAASLKERAVRELEEAIGVRDGYDPAAAERADGDVVVFDSEGPKEADGTPVDGN